MVYTHFDISIHVFCVDFTRVSLVLFTRYLLSRALLRSFLVLMLMLRTGLMNTSIVIYLRLLVLL
jgi:hypothetical protein